MISSVQASMASGPSVEGTHTPPPRRYKPPSRIAFEKLRADYRLNALDKLLLSILAGYCLAEGNCLCWPSNAELAELAGIQPTKTGHYPSIVRSLARLEGWGILERIGRYDLADWMANVGRPRLGLADPRPRRDPARYLLLWWKIPGAGADFEIPPVRARRWSALAPS